jgi:hypothetical protein
MALMSATILFIAISDTSLLSPLLSAKIGSHCLCWWARLGSNQRPPACKFCPLRPWMSVRVRDVRTLAVVDSGCVAASAAVAVSAVVRGVRPAGSRATRRGPQAAARRAIRKTSARRSTATTNA